ncbi:hypothetical protein LBJG_00354 [Lactobacillus jensenii 1153]|jgi:hypothetical protein|nr:hypothetical protein LBJG_00354 [Lactobacillus jensenii 1153]ERJ44093.2 hypothetical protein N581_08140 [Lactobacillus jensenii MD IIE-70(2)]
MKIMTRKKEFRTQLSDEEWKLINEIREKNPAIKTAHDVLVLFVHDHLACKNLQTELKDLKNINFNLQTLMEVTGELMVKGRGFQDDNGLPITNVQVGSQYISIKSAKQKVKKEIAAGQINKHWHKAVVNE